MKPQHTPGSSHQNTLWHPQMAVSWAVTCYSSSVLIFLIRKIIMLYNFSSLISLPQCCCCTQFHPYALSFTLFLSLRTVLNYWFPLNSPILVSAALCVNLLLSVVKRQTTLSFFFNCFWRGDETKGGRLNSVCRGVPKAAVSSVNECCKWCWRIVLRSSHANFPSVCTGVLHLTYLYDGLW